MISLGKLALSDVLLSHVDSLLIKRAVIGQVMSLIELVDGNRLSHVLFGSVVVCLILSTGSHLEIANLFGLGCWRYLKVLHLI